MWHKNSQKRVKNVSKSVKKGKNVSSLDVKLKLGNQARNLCACCSRGHHLRELTRRRGAWALDIGSERSDGGRGRSPRGGEGRSRCTSCRRTSLRSALGLLQITFQLFRLIGLLCSFGWILDFGDSALFVSVDSVKGGLYIYVNCRWSCFTSTFRPTSTHPKTSPLAPKPKVRTLSSGRMSLSQTQDISSLGFWQGLMTSRQAGVG